MTNIGKRVLTIPDHVEVVLNNENIYVRGPLGQQRLTIPRGLGLVRVADTLSIRGAAHDPLWGMFRSKVANTLEGVSRGFGIRLRLEGVGYRGAVVGSQLELRVGFSHPVYYPIPAGITIKCIKPTLVYIWGAEKDRVTQVAAEIRSVRKPEPYKGKGIIYDGPTAEVILRKEGKRQ